jgi:hypothetical protein
MCHLVCAQAAIFFWADDNSDSWKSDASGETQVELPWQEAFGLESACQNGGFGAVWLFVYGHQVIGNLPPGVMQRDAAEFLSWGDAQAMRGRGVPVALISDVVRLLVATEEGGVVADCDLWWLRPAPPIPFVATLFEKREGGRAGPSSTTTQRYAAFERPGWDGLGLVNTPFGVQPRPSRFANEMGKIIRQFIDNFTIGPFFFDQKNWNFIMHAVRDLTLQLGMGSVARPPIEFGAALSWGAQRKSGAAHSGTRVP